MSLLLDVGASVRTAADELPIAGVVAAADRLRAAIDLLTWVRTASIRPLGVPQLAGALEHSEHAAYALLVARDELATYLKAIGLPGDAPPATPPPQRAPTPAAPPATGAATGSGLPPLLRWWCERVDALTGCAGDYDESDAAPDSTELLRRVANAGDRTKLRAELVRSSPPIGLGLAALAPVGLRNLAAELLGHPPGPQDLRRLEGAVSGRINDHLPHLRPETSRVLLGRVCRTREEPESPPHPADAAIAGGVLVAALLRRLGRSPRDVDRYLREPVYA